MMESDNQPAVKPRVDPETSIKETLQSIVIAFVLAFVFRAFVVEAFVIPTGSMAPTLLGQHLHYTCPKCGYVFDVGPMYEVINRNTGMPTPTYHQGVGAELPAGNKGQELKFECPMCGYEIRQPTRLIDDGDRILVLKYIYALREPKRWDVVVFKNPADPKDNYIKRLTGLPNEQLRIVNGDIFTRPRDSAPDGRWQVQRKTQKAQEAVWQPVYHSDYVRLKDDEEDLFGSNAAWVSPWVDEQDKSGDWEVKDDQRTFRFTHEQSSAELKFHYTKWYMGFDYYIYDRANQPYNARNPVDDMRVGANIVPESSGLGAKLTIDTMAATYRGVIDADGAASIECVARDDSQSSWVEKATERVALEANRCTRVELWHVDRQVQLWVDGECVVERQYDDALDEQGMQRIIRSMRRTQQPAAVSIEVSGAAARLTQVNLDRDLYYTQDGERGMQEQPVTIGPDDYFCMGDNSPRSSDGRMWSTVDPWVSYLTMDGNHPMGVPNGLVPRKLMIGRAFFVYFPAAYRLESKQHWLIPNFGDMRFIH